MTAAGETRFIVTWQVETSARTPYEAAWRAVEAGRAAGEYPALPIVFTVTTVAGPQPGTTDRVTIDLTGEDNFPCDECGEPSGGGEGYDGLCGDCADKAEAAKRWGP